MSEVEKLAKEGQKIADGLYKVDRIFKRDAILTGETVTFILSRESTLLSRLKKREEAIERAIEECQDAELYGTAADLKATLADREVE